MAASGVPLWRLSGEKGQVTECFLDAASADEWLLTLWKDQKLHLSELYPAQEAGAARAAALRTEMLAKEWTELRTM